MTQRQEPDRASRTARTGIAAGMIGVAAIAGGSLVAAIAYKGTGGEAYNPTNHFVSELGELGVSQLAIAFNLGLMAGGIGFVLFMVALARSMGGRLRWAWGPIGVVAGIGGFFVGIFPMNELARHTTAAMTFFNLGWIAVGIASVDFVLRRDPRFPRPLAAVGALTVIAFIGFLRSIDSNTVSPAEVLAAPDHRPAFWIVPTLEWAVIAGILAWVFLTAWAWRRALRRGTTG